MAFWIQGHDEKNDDLHGSGDAADMGNRANAGWSEDADNGILRPAGPSRRIGAWGGQGYAYDQDGYAVPGTTGGQQDTARYRRMGERTAAPVQLDQSQAAGARQLQLGSLGLLRQGALGQAPSRAATLGQLSTESAVRASSAAAARGRGGAGSIMATRGAMGSLGATTAAQNLQLGELRGREIAQERAGFVGGASGMRRQDIGAATENAKLEAQQRALEDQRQRQYEKMGWDTSNAEMFGLIEERRLADSQALAQRQIRAAEEQADYDKTRDYATIGSGFATGGLTAYAASRSDRRAKDVVPAGSLAALMGGRRG
jgi:hypothetical protein